MVYFHLFNQKYKFELKEFSALIGFSSFKVEPHSIIIEMTLH